MTFFVMDLKGARDSGIAADDCILFPGRPLNIAMTNGIKEINIENIAMRGEVRGCQGSDEDIRRMGHDTPIADDIDVRGASFLSVSFQK
jgi:hypothetical protein